MSASSSSQGRNMPNDTQDPILTSIRTIEAIRDFASDIIPLRPDGANLNEWVNEIEKVLSDLIDREKYLHEPPTEPLNKHQDKIARNLIYWTIPRALRSCIHDTSSAHQAYQALHGQFLRNNRTSHMASLVDLFNVHAEITEPQHITILYDQMFKGMNELLASGFQITPDTILGALFQIAVGRGNSHLYMATSQLLDTLVPTDRQVTSREVSAAARRVFEHSRSTIFEEESSSPLPHDTSTSDVTDSTTHVPIHQDSINLSTIGSNLFSHRTAHAHPPTPSRKSTGHEIPAKRPTPPGGPNSRQDTEEEEPAQPLPANLPSSSTPNDSSSTTQAAPPSNTTVQGTQQPSNTSTTEQQQQQQQQQQQTSRPNSFLFDSHPSAASKGRAISPAPSGSRPGSGKPPAAATNTTSTASLLGALPSTTGAPSGTAAAPGPDNAAATAAAYSAACTAATAAASTAAAAKKVANTTRTTGLFGHSSVTATSAALGKPASGTGGTTSSSLFTATSTASPFNAAAAAAKPPFFFRSPAQPQMPPSHPPQDSKPVLFASIFSSSSAGITPKSEPLAHPADKDQKKT
ncbi:hypothetical protein PCANC_01532 [Puccinia coronata f. sp. avenae]|uniref:Uncharacterized protein n=1 Tax=Puccinia coronata f. sp. avenae TaxID=200324 RepID=A0A2N5W2W0_9BASI|nr:hypothetical protein PCASD_21306 [Puccinia coronata f. sp. avenae]PLW56583.1 hypothetical protein PCANC_01532 [Puccinia coronata f. sp. avenae]